MIDMKFVGPDWKEISEDKIATRQSPGSVMPGKGIKLNETTGEISVTTGIYSITYDMDGGTNNPSNPSTYSYNSPTITLAEPTKEHYDFVGWTGSNGTTPQKSVTITPSIETSTDLEYKANWAIKTYTVSWKWVLAKIDGSEEVYTPGDYDLQIQYGTSIKDAGGVVPSLSRYWSGSDYELPEHWVYENTETPLNINTPITSDTTLVSISSEKQIIYAYCVNENDSNPSTRVTYPDGCYNENFTPAGFDNNGTFHLNDWSNEPIATSSWFSPCALKFDGTVDYYLDPSDYSKKIDGTASDYNNPDYEGNMMVQVKKMYTKRVYDSVNKKRYFYVSKSKVDNDYECDTFINKYGVEQDYIYLPLFKGSVINSKLRSIAGKTPSVSKTIEQNVNYAAACGDRWQIWDFSSHELIRDLCTLISKSTDSQSSFGQGYSSASLYIAGGSLYNLNWQDSDGFYGSQSDGTVHCKVFHIEDFWGNRHDWMQGLILSSYNIYTKGYPPYSYTSTSGYTNQGNCGISSSYIGGFYKTALWTKNGQIPTWAGGEGSSSTYECDYIWLNSGTNIAGFGGAWNIGSSGGSGYLHMALTASATSSNFGGSPLYK